MHSLPLFVRLADRPVILLGEGEAAAAKRRLLERAGARIVDEGATAALAIIAIEDEAQAQAAAARLKARGVLVNAVDRPALCDFTLPAIVDRDPVLIAVGTGGASAGLAKAVRQRIETLLPERLGALAQGLGRARAAMRAQWPDPAERRRALDRALASGGILDVTGNPTDADIRLFLSGESTDGFTSIVEIRLVSEDPDDMTLRTARLLGEADIVYHHPAVPSAILNRARADATRIMCNAPPATVTSGLSLWITLPGAGEHRS